jgi:hypothetical protein
MACDVRIQNGSISLRIVPVAKIVGRELYNKGPGSVVGIATAYGLDGPGIESR